MNCPWCEYATSNAWWGKDFYLAHGDGATHCRDCHTTFRGVTQHCVRCHENFSSDTSASMHEVIDQRTCEIYCLSPEDRGLVWNENLQRWNKPGDEARVERLKATRAVATTRRGREAIL